MQRLTLLVAQLLIISMTRCIGLLYPVPSCIILYPLCPLFPYNSSYVCLYVPSYVSYVLVCTHIWPIYTPMSPPTPTYVPSYLPMSHLCPLQCLHKSCLMSLLCLLCPHLYPYMCSCGYPMFQLCIFYVPLFSMSPLIPSYVLSCVSYIPMCSFYVPPHQSHSQCSITV